MDVSSLPLQNVNGLFYRDCFWVCLGASNGLFSLRVAWQITLWWTTALVSGPVRATRWRWRRTGSRCAFPAPIYAPKVLFLFKTHLKHFLNILKVKRTSFAVVLLCLRWSSFWLLLQHVTALALPVFRRLKPSTPVTLTDSSIVRRSTATLCFSSQGLKGEHLHFHWHFRLNIGYWIAESHSTYRVFYQLTAALMMREGICGT